MEIPDYKAISRILWKHDLMHTCCRVNEGMEDEYDSEAGILVELLSESTGPVDFNALARAFVKSFEFCFSEGCLRNRPWKVAVREIWLELFKPEKKWRPEVIQWEQRHHSRAIAPLFTYPHERPSPYRWVPPHLESDGVTARFPPHPVEARAPRLWLVSDGNQAWLVNLFEVPLPSVRIARTGFGSSDCATFPYSASDDWSYENIQPNHCVLVDEWDGYYCLDFYIYCELTVTLPGSSEQYFRVGGGLEKGCIATQVLLWDNGAVGPLK